MSKSRHEKIVDELAAGHPDTGPYSADDVTALAEMTAANRTVAVTELTGNQMFTATDSGEFGAITAEKRQLWLSFCSSAAVDPWHASNVAFVQWIFSGLGGASVAALNGLRNQTVGRNIELGLGDLSLHDIEYGRAG